MFYFLELGTNYFFLYFPFFIIIVVVVVVIIYSLVQVSSEVISL